MQGGTTTMNWKSKKLWIKLIAGARKLSNVFWAFTVSVGSAGFVLAGISSFLDRNLISFVPPQEIPFFPQGIVMLFYGFGGCFISLYLWSTIFWNVGSGYDGFDRKEEVASSFRWGFPGQKRRTTVRVYIKDIQAVRIRGKEGPYGYRVRYMEIRSQVLVIRRDEDLTSGKVEEEAVELAFFLRVPIEIS
uniref:Photosystem I assembly protein Ycf4 n=1 Tax=Adenocalymma subspicatum TaxID=2056452 RepID=A0A2H4RG47_9LAMI|nr:photosystem I assembly protein ycf4 [Adenocalymma subspicatum]ATY48511.1 photosystem I assembly protein ycf4 [Adenocalymma subspicatum]